MNTLAKIIALFLIALTSQTSIIEASVTKDQIVIKKVALSPTFCPSVDLLDNVTNKEIMLYLYFEDIDSGRAKEYKGNFAAMTYDINDSPVEATTKCEFRNINDVYISCNVKFVNLTTGKYYISFEENEGDNWKISAYNTKSDPFEIKENGNDNFFYRHEKDNEYLETYHGYNNEAKKDYAILHFYNKLTEIPEISVEDGDKTTKIPCTFSELDEYFIKCDVNDQDFTPNKQLWLNIATKCTGLTDKIPYIYEMELFPFIKITSYSLDKKCSKKDERLKFTFEFEELEGPFDRNPEGKKYSLLHCIKSTRHDDEEHSRYEDTEEMTECYFSGTNSITCYLDTESDRNINRDLVNVYSCLSEGGDYPLIIRPFVFKNAFMVNNESVNPVNSSFTQYIKYDKNGEGKIVITFEEPIPERYNPTLKINNQELNCTHDDLTLTCKISILQFPPAVIGMGYAYYKGELSTVCGENYNNKIDIYVKSDEIINFIQLKNPELEKSCHIYTGLTSQEIHFTLSYNEIIKGTTYSLKDFNIDMVLDSNNNINFTASCTYDLAGNLFNCHFPENSVQDLPSGSYTPTLKNGKVFIDYIIMPFYSEKSIYLSNEKIPKPVEPLSEGKVVLNAEFSGSVTSIPMVIKFEDNLKDGFIPTVEINGKLLSCGKTKENYLSCIITQEEFPSATYNGEMKNICGEKIVDITLISTKGKTTIELINPVFEKTCHISTGKESQNIEFTLGYQEKDRRENYTLTAFSIDLVLTNNKDKKISASCKYDSTKNLFKCNFPEDSVKDSGYYTPTLKDELNFDDLIIYPFTSDKSIYLTSEKIPKPVDPLSEEGKVVLNAEFSDSVSAIPVLINFEDNLNDDFIPTVEINGTLLSCEKTNQNYLSCFILKDDFPAGTYNGEMKNICGDKIVDITLTTTKKTEETEDTPKSTTNKGLIVGISVLGVVVVALIAVLVLMKMNRRKYIDSKLVENMKI